MKRGTPSPRRGERVDHLVVELAASGEHADHGARVFGSERAELDRVLLETGERGRELGRPHRDEQQQTGGQRARRQAPQCLDRGVVRPVDVLDDHGERRRLRLRRDPIDQRGDDRLAQPIGGELGRGMGGVAVTDEGLEDASRVLGQADVLAPCAQRGAHVARLGRRTDLERLLDPAPHRAQPHMAVVAPAVDLDHVAVVAGELDRVAGQATLPDARVTGEHEQTRLVPALAHGPPRVVDARSLRGPTDER